MAKVLCNQTNLHWYVSDVSVKDKFTLLDILVLDFENLYFFCSSIFFSTLKVHCACFIYDDMTRPVSSPFNAEVVVDI